VVELAVEIKGWDGVDYCCIREIAGYNCALQKQATLRYCYTSQVGGVIKYVYVNNVRVDTKLYRDFIYDFDKIQIANKPCNVEKYPGILR